MQLMQLKIFVRSIFMVDLPHENILPTKISRITVCSLKAASAKCAILHCTYGHANMVTINITHETIHACKHPVMYKL